MIRTHRRRLIAILKGAVQVILALGIISYLVWTNWTRIASELQNRPIRWSFMLLGFVICLAAILLTFLRWFLLVSAQGLPFRVRDSLRIGFIGFFFNLLIPGAVGGDLVKAVLLAREQKRKTTAIATVLIDRIVGLYGLVLLAGLASGLFWSDVRQTTELRQIAYFTVALLAGTSFAILALFSEAVNRGRPAVWAARLPIVGGAIAEAMAAMSVYRAKWRVLVVTVVMSILGHTGFLMALRCGMLALADDVPAARVHFLLAPLGLMVGAVPLTPGGAGPVEFVMKWLFGLIHENHGALALLMMLAFRAMQVLAAVVGMIYYLASRTETRQALAEAESTLHATGSPV